MVINQVQFSAVVEAAKAKAANQPSWLRAIEKAAAQILSNPCITELASGVMITSPSGNTYLANGVCSCKAFEFKMPCWHRAAAQLIKRYDEAVTAASSLPDERAQLIADIKATWPRVNPHTDLADALMARFRTNSLNTLNIDFLRRIQAVLA